MKHKPVLSKIFDDNLSLANYKIRRLIDNSVLSDVTLDVRGGVDMSFTYDIWVLVREEA